MTPTASEIAARVRAGAADPVLITEQALARIAAVDGVLGAFRVVRDKAALAEAAAVRERPDLAELPLAGVPVAVKDVAAISGECVTNGALAAATEPADADHVIVRRLRDAGAIVVGITRVPELCIWPMSDDPAGTARNPWDPAYTAGGSSGGSGSAVAAGLVPIAHGTDGMGSVRLPAAICGLVGVKPGSGVIKEPDAMSWYGMSSHGSLTTTVADAGLMLSVLAERPELAEVTEPVAPLRIAVSTRAPLGVPVQHRIRDAATTAAAGLSDEGHLVTRATPHYGLSTVVGMAVRWFAGPSEQADALDHALLQRRTRAHIGAGHALRRAGLIRPRTAERWRTRAARFFEEYDVLLTPTFATVPPEARSWHRRSWLSNAISAARFAPFTGPWNLAGFPAMTVPAGHDKNGLPLGVQLVAAPDGERLLLSLAAQLERRNPWPRTVAD
ncbi:MAG: amidase [Haloechinothrix sp.]